MKKSYFTDDIDFQITEQEQSDEDIEETGVEDDDVDDEARSILLTDSTGMDIEYGSGASDVLAQAESRASIPPLDVTLDDIEHSDMENFISQNQKNNEATTIDEKNKRRAKKKAKEERSFISLFLF